MYHLLLFIRSCNKNAEEEELTSHASFWTFKMCSFSSSSVSMPVCALKNATSSIVGAYRLGSSTTLLGSNDMVAAGYRSCHGYDALLRSCCASERKERVPQGGYLYILDHLFVYSKSRIKLAEKPRLNIVPNISIILGAWLSRNVGPKLQTFSSTTCMDERTYLYYIKHTFLSSPSYKNSCRIPIVGW